MEVKTLFDLPGIESTPEDFTKWAALTIEDLYPYTLFCKMAHCSLALDKFEHEEISVSMKGKIETSDGVSTLSFYESGEVLVVSGDGSTQDVRDVPSYQRKPREVAFIRAIRQGPNRVQVTCKSFDIPGFALVDDLKNFLYEILRVYRLPGQPRQKKTGRPPLTEEEWQERFDKVASVQQTREKRNCTLEQACAWEQVPYSSFINWQRRMTNKS
jgi:hypothetical protein